MSEFINSTAFHQHLIRAGRGLFRDALLSSCITFHLAWSVAAASLRWSIVCRSRVDRITNFHWKVFIFHWWLVFCQGEVPRGKSLNIAICCLLAWNKQCWGENLSSILEDEFLLLRHFPERSARVQQRRYVMDQSRGLRVNGQLLWGEWRWISIERSKRLCKICSIMTLFLCKIPFCCWPDLKSENQVHAKFVR